MTRGAASGRAPGSSPALDGAPALDIGLLARAGLFVLALLIFWITLEPLKDLSDGALLEPTEAADRFNQVVFLTLFGLSLWALRAGGWRRAAPLLHPAYGAVLGWFLLDCAFAINPGLSLRRLILSAMVMAIVGVLLLLPRSQRQFEAWIGGVAITVVVLCFLAVALVPHLAVHQADAAAEVNLTGSWRGIYDHKSRTGPMMVVFLILGAYLTGRWRLVLGPCLFVLAGTFLAFTGAKQPQALVPFVFAWAWLAGRIRSVPLLLAVCLVPLVLYLTFTVGSAAIPAVAAFNERVMSDPTFTNRTGIWGFALASFLERPLTGYGFMGFWNTEYVRYAVDAARNPWAATASHSHDSYLDLALTTGLPGLALAVWALVVLPILDFARARRDPASRDLALLFFRIWLFAVFLGSMETLFFQRDEAFWVAFLIAVFGLRYLTAYRVRE